MEKVFDQSDIEMFGEIIRGEGVDSNSTKLLRIHSFIDVRLDVLIQDLNQNDPSFLGALSTFRPVYESRYFNMDEGFQIPPDLSFAGKIKCLSSFKFLPAAQTEILIRFNRVRNRLAHDYKQAFSKKDLTYIFEPVLHDPNYETPDTILKSDDLEISLVYHLGNLVLAIIFHHQAIPAIAEILLD